MQLFKYCENCEHIEEDHAMDAPKGEQECLNENCDCQNFIPKVYDLL